MQALLAYGDGEAAVKITFQNERILFLLGTVRDSGDKSNISATRELVESCLLLQEDCDGKLESIASEYKKEFNSVSIKRQVSEHLKNT